MKYKTRGDVSYTYRCGGCQEKFTTEIPNYHLNHKCPYCESSLFPSTMSLDERLTRPIQPKTKR